ncbi:MAG TPA: methylated-DNA--[protein]-cysteine S-methyltransferase [Candidatus Megaira endosymbiont of Nemacystus decipiens]|nr:methylated-DNA--[protein]-cysteine S-methyltransferase [Candidatus Megaera endosymbiont of Nemacystus decipiens]
MDDNAFEQTVDFIASTISNPSKLLKVKLFITDLGKMITIGDDHGIYLLEFCDRKYLDEGIYNLCKKWNFNIAFGTTKAIDSIEKEIKMYLCGKLTSFKTHCYMLGTSFQKKAWQELLNIPYGKTKSYLEQAQAVEKPSAFRAVANANAKNRLAIIIPCHRVIQTDGGIGGYGAGVVRKKWLIQHEADSITFDKIYL